MHTCSSTDAGRTGEILQRTRRLRTVCPDESLQVAIITGSGQGVGAAAAKLFAEHGAKVVVTDIDSNKSEQVLRHSALYLPLWPSV